MITDNVLQNLNLEKVLISHLLNCQFIKDYSKFDMLDDLKFDKEHFFYPENEIIFEVIMKIYNDKKILNTTILITELDKIDKNLKKDLDIKGNKMIEQEFEYCITQLKELSIRRQTIAFAQQISEKAFDFDVNIIDHLTNSSNKLIDLAETTLNKPIPDIKELVLKERQRIYDIHSGKIKNLGLSTGYTLIDKYTQGFNAGDYVIIAGRPGTGKSALAINIMYNVSVIQNKPSAYFSFESSNQNIVKRLFNNCAEINKYDIREGMLKTDLEKIDNATSILYDTSIYMKTTYDDSILDLKQQIKILKKKRNIEIVFIDYIQLVESEINKHGNRNEAVSFISRKIKAIAKECDIPVVALSQLSRNGSKTKPVMSDLRDSGSLEQDADVIIMLHNPKVEGKKEYDFMGTKIDLETDIDYINVDILKNKEGDTVDFMLEFDKKIQKFSNYSNEKLFSNEQPKF